ncbi:hypothetical protein RNQ77_13870, partial [Escherichia coli]|nr:hypothetical protein [Escherichia coli]MDT1297279.1 hypothetical protein [Escherichia coli]
HVNDTQVTKPARIIGARRTELLSSHTPVNDETMQEINTLLIALDKTWDDDLLPLCSQIFRRDIRASSELTQAEAVKALGFLKQKATEQKVAA